MKFRINYIDPETQQRESVVEDFEDGVFDLTDCNGNVIGSADIPAREWASDYGYALADKGWFEVIAL